MIEYQVILFLSFLIPFLIKFILWPSKKNIMFIQEIPFFILANLGGCVYLFDYSINKHSLNTDNIEGLVYLMLIGSLLYTLAFYLGFKSKLKIKNSIYIKIKKLVYKIDLRYNLMIKKMHFLIAFLSIIAIIFFIYSYFVMGFTPMFAKNPLEAKYFAGIYQEQYLPVAYYFRIALNISIMVNPFLIIFIFNSHSYMKYFYVILFVLIFILVLLSLRRSSLAASIISMIFIFVIYYKNSKYILHFSVIYFLIFIAGSATTAILFYFIGLNDDFDIIAIVKGVPDVSDLLWFWDSFIKNNYEFSYGRTIYGGLVPHHYDWNPSVVTKLVIGAGKNIATGGFRLPFQLDGYIAFGILGTIIWSIYNGLIEGIYLKSMKIIFEIKINSFLKLYFLYFFITFIYTILMFLIEMRIDNIVIIFLSFILLFYVKKKIILRKIYDNN